jgi:hypothetical protein
MFEYPVLYPISCSCFASFEVADNLLYFWKICRPYPATPQLKPTKTEVGLIWMAIGGIIHLVFVKLLVDRLCGLVVRVPGYRSRGPGFDSRPYQILWEVVGLEQGPLSLVSTTEQLLGRMSSCFGLENWEYGRGGPLCWSRDTHHRSV